MILILNLQGILKQHTVVFKVYTQKQLPTKQTGFSWKATKAISCIYLPLHHRQSLLASLLPL